MKNFFTIILSVLLMTSCEVFESSGPLSFITKKDNSDAIIIKPQTPEEKLAILKNDFFNVQCIRCHNPERPKRVDLTNNENLDIYFNNILYRITEAFKTGEGQMPPRGEEASEQLVKIYKEWKKEITYNSLQKDFFTTSCLRCHNPERTSRLDLTNEKNILENYDDILYRITEAHDQNDGKMPPIGPRPTLEKAELLTLYKKLSDNLK